MQHNSYGNNIVPDESSFMVAEASKPLSHNRFVILVTKAAAA
jgi:hypothetical protein